MKPWHEFEGPKFHCHLFVGHFNRSFLNFPVLISNRNEQKDAYAKGSFQHNQ